ncbi:MAG: hypothetical protein V3S43_06300 [Acidimicrobiia bacterium]
MPYTPLLTGGGRPQIANPLFVPKAPGNFTTADSGIPDRYLRWLNGQHQQNMQLHQMSHGDRPGYVVLSGKTAADTIEIAENLGLNKSFVDIAANRIRYAEMVLAWLPADEARKRKDEQLKYAQSRAGTADEEYFNRMDRNRYKAFRRQYGEHEDRREHATRDGKPFVSFSRSTNGDE